MLENGTSIRPSRYGWILEVVQDDELRFTVIRNSRNECLREFFRYIGRSY